MLISKGLPECLWAEAVSHAAYLGNWASTRALKGATPNELWDGVKPNVAHLREFRSLVYVLIEDNNKSKLKPRSEKHIFVGFTDGSKSVKYYNMTTHQVKTLRNYIFLNAPVLQCEGENGSKDTLAPTGTVDAQHTEAKAVPAESKAKEKSSKKRVLPESESELRRSKRQTVRHNYQDLHNPEPE
jgi:hypothetical protein